MEINLQIAAEGVPVADELLSLAMENERRAVNPVGEAPPPYQLTLIAQHTCHDDIQGLTRISIENLLSDACLPTSSW